MKICTVVLTHDSPLYNHFDGIKRKYLYSKGHDFFFSYNGTDASKNDLKNKNINYLSTETHTSGIPMMYNKFLKIIQDGMLDSYDFVLRENSSTFVNIDNIENYIKTINNLHYAGYFRPAWNFCAGTLTIFSRQSINILRDYGSAYVHDHREDDVVIGDVMSAYNIEKTFIPRFDISDLRHIPDKTLVKHALTQPHIRIRNDYNRNVIDIAIWNYIEQILNL